MPTVSAVFADDGFSVVAPCPWQVVLNMDPHKSRQLETHHAQFPLIKRGRMSVLFLLKFMTSSFIFELFKTRLFCSPNIKRHKSAYLQQPRRQPPLRHDCPKQSCPAALKDLSVGNRPPWRALAADLRPATGGHSKPPHYPADSIQCTATYFQFSNLNKAFSVNQFVAGFT